MIQLILSVVKKSHSEEPAVQSQDTPVPPWQGFDRVMRSMRAFKPSTVSTSEDMLVCLLHHSTILPACRSLGCKLVSLPSSNHLSVGNDLTPYSSCSPRHRSSLLLLIYLHAGILSDVQPGKNDLAAFCADFFCGLTVYQHDGQSSPLHASSSSHLYSGSRA